MKIQYSSMPLVLGLMNSEPRVAWDLDYHALLTSSSNHRLKNGAWSGGGGFFVHHNTVTSYPGFVPVTTLFGNTFGGMTACATAPGSPMPQPAALSFEDEKSTLEPHGATGWKRARPGNPVANMGQFLIELREAKRLFPWSIFKGSFKGIPRRAMAAVDTARKNGGHYLAYNFGWVPLVSDLRKMYNLTFDIDRRIAMLRRDNGRSLKRARTLKDTTETTEQNFSSGKPFNYLAVTPILNLSAGTSYRKVVTTTREKLWFEGRFRYYVPNIGTLEWERRARRALWGAEVTPSLLWEVMPWSWLIDWFSNVGDVISNMSANAVDNTISQYAYVMRTLETETVETVTTSWAGRTTAPVYSAGSTTTSLKIVDTRKSRVAATPYGFGITYDGLSAYQTSILAALAIQRWG